MNRMIKTTLLCLFNALSFALVWSQSPVWPLATNPHNYDVTSPVMSEVGWLVDTNPSTNKDTKKLNFNISIYWCFVKVHQ